MWQISLILTLNLLPCLESVLGRAELLGHSSSPVLFSPPTTSLYPKVIVRLQCFHAFMLSCFHVSADAKRVACIRVCRFSVVVLMKITT